MGSIDVAMHRATRRAVAEADVRRKLEAVEQCAREMHDCADKLCSHDYSGPIPPVLKTRMRVLRLALVDLDMARQRAKDL